MADRRKMEEIQAEYQSVAMKLGHTLYQEWTFKKEVELLNERLRDLNLEAAAVQAETAKAKADADAAAKAAPTPPETTEQGVL